MFVVLQVVFIKGIEINFVAQLSARPRDLAVWKLCQSATCNEIRTILETMSLH